MNCREENLLPEDDGDDWLSQVLSELLPIIGKGICLYIALPLIAGFVWTKVSSEYVFGIFFFWEFVGRFVISFGVVVFMAFLIKFLKNKRKSSA